MTHPWRQQTAWLATLCAVMTSIWTPPLHSAPGPDAAVPDAPVPDLRSRNNGEDWPTFLGPRGDGKSIETGILKTWPKGGPPLVWRRPVGDGYAVPSISKGRLFHFDRHDDRVRLVCLNSETGTELWRSEYATDYQDTFGYSQGPKAMPVVDDDRVYTFGAGGRLRAHRVTDGKVMWDVDTAARYGVVQNFFGVASTPVIEGQLLIVMVGGSPPEGPDIFSGEVQGNGSALVAFDKMTGEQRYRLSNELASYSSPRVHTIGGQRQGLAFTRGGLLVFDPAKGKERFFHPFRAKKLYSVNAATPVVVGERIWITESYELGSALLQLEAGGLKELWRDPPKRGQRLASHWATPLHHEGVLYGCHGEKSGNAELRALDWATGEIKWKHKGWNRSTLLYADQHLLVLGEYGELHLVQATADKFEVVASSQLEAASEDGKSKALTYPAWNAPILSHGLLYVKGANQLVCLELISAAPGGAAAQ